MTIDEGHEAQLEDNVGALFERLRVRAPVSDAARAAVLARLLEETPGSSGHRAPMRRRRWLRWTGLAAALLLAASMLTWDRVDLAGNAPTAGETGPATAFAIHLLANGPGIGVVEAATPKGGESVYVSSERHVSEADVDSARVEETVSGCRIGIRLTPAGTRRLAELTRDHVGGRLAVVLDGKVVMSPTIRSEITDGLVTLTGNFTKRRCEEIAQRMSAR